ncbi:hypothetical protein HYU20_03730 [Candidatus Woesearchaeota archaeon]|nr:hypothetical protein [Candidatus Woesearchaeota archaeon]
MEEHNVKKHRHQKGGKKEIKITIPEIKGLDWGTITTAAVVILLALVAFQAYQARALTQKVIAMEAKAVEESKLPSIEVTAIEADGCAQCTPLESITAQVAAARANVTKSTVLKSADSESQQLIREYSIRRLPTAIVTGEVDKAGIAGFTKVGNALVHTQTAPPYVDVATGSVKGLVTLTYVNASGCSECPDLMPAVQQLRSLITVKGINVVDKDSPEGKELVGEYAMTRLPGILVSSDVAEYPLSAQLAATGTVKKDGSIALGANPPYLNTSTGKVDGIANLIMLNDSSCGSCYDVTMHIPIVKRFQVYLGSTKAVDASSAEGKELTAKYNITAVPTILITGDVSVYAQLAAVWGAVGTVEEDGAYVFRTMSAIAGRQYKNLATGKVEQNLPQQ